MVNISRHVHSQGASSESVSPHLCIVHAFHYFIILQIWEVGKKYVRNILNPHLIDTDPNRIFCLRFSPDGRHLASGLFDGKVRIWNQRDGSSRVFHNSDTGIWSACFSPDGRQIAAGNSVGDVLIWEVRSGHLVASWKGHTNVLTRIAFMPNGKGLISGSWDNTMRYWDIGSTLSQMSDEKGHDAAGDEEKKESLTFVGHTVGSFLATDFIC